MYMYVYIFLHVCTGSDSISIRRGSIDNLISVAGHYIPLTVLSLLDPRMAYVK